MENLSIHNNPSLLFFITSWVQLYEQNFPVTFQVRVIIVMPVRQILITMIQSENIQPLHFTWTIQRKATVWYLSTCDSWNLSPSIMALIHGSFHSIPNFILISVIINQNFKKSFKSQDKKSSKNHIRCKVVLVNFFT